MVEPNSAIATISSIAATVKDMKGILDVFPVGIVLPPNKAKLIKLKDNVRHLEIECTKLSQLIRNYSSLLSEVRIAKALSDKAYELIMFVPDLGSGQLAIFSNDIETRHSVINRDINRLPIIDATETGVMERELTVIRDLIRDLKKDVQNNDGSVKRDFADISTHYADLEGILSRLLEKLLQSLDSSK